MHLDRHGNRVWQQAKALRKGSAPVFRGPLPPNLRLGYGFGTLAGPSIRRAAQIPGLIPSPGTQPRSPISGQHCREAFLQVLDEILGNLQRREMPPGFGRLPSDDLSVPLLCPGARTLLDVAGIYTDC